MSDAATPSGSPVSPPIPNMGRKDNANNIGVLNLMEPPHKEIKNAVRTTTDGIDMIMVVNWKKALIDCPIPVRNMWWAQTMNDMKPRNEMAYTSDL